MVTLKGSHSLSVVLAMLCIKQGSSTNDFPDLEVRTHLIREYKETPLVLQERSKQKNLSQTTTCATPM